MEPGTVWTEQDMKRRGFTLVELLVVIGIILVIAGIALPALIKAYSHSEKSKGRADLNTIAVCLEAYKQDYGDYPRLPTDPVTGNPVANTGAAILCKALVGPGNAITAAPVWSGSPTVYNPGDMVVDSGVTYLCIVTIPTTGGSAYAPTSNTTYWVRFDDIDGLDGPGWRPRQGAKVQAAYLQMERFKLRDMAICNRDNQIILYYPANPGSPRIDKVPGSNTVAPDPLGGWYGGYVGPTPAAGKPLPLYNSNDNLALMPLNSLRALLGDYGLDGAIDNAVGVENPVATQVRFVLITPGPDGTYGPSSPALQTGAPTAAKWSNNKASVAGCDDIVNFER